MPEVKPDIETLAKIKVIGVGGSGNAAISRMIKDKIKGVEFIAINTDAQALHHSPATKKLHIGKQTTRGLGAGMDPNLGLKAAEESQSEIHDLLKASDMVFVTCGLGGGTGTGASPLVANTARELGALTVAVVTKPFSFEGAQRMEIAERGLEDLRDRVDTLIVIPNDRILQIVDKKTSLLAAFGIVDEVLKQGVQGISEIITIPGLINVDFADVKAIMKDSGSALMGIGRASGEGRAIEAAKMAVDSPLLELSIEGAQGILFTITGGKDLGMHEIDEAAKVITEMADDNAKVIFGANIDETLKDEIRITVIATGFGNLPKRISRAEEQHDKGKSHFFENDKSDKRSRSRQSEESDFERPASFGQRLKYGLGLEPRSEETEEDKIDLDLKESEEQSEEKRLDIPAFIRKKMM